MIPIRRTCLIPCVFSSYFPTAIVSGRCRDKVNNFVKLAELYYAGSHGMDIKGPTNARKQARRSTTKAKAKTVLFQPASEFLPMIDEVFKNLIEKTKSTPGAKVENNKFCISVHFRRVEEKAAKILANFLVAGSALLGRAVLQAYRKALQSSFLPLMSLMLYI